MPKLKALVGGLVVGCVIAPLIGFALLKFHQSAVNEAVEKVEAKKSEQKHEEKLPAVVPQVPLEPKREQPVPPVKEPAKPPAMLRFPLKVESKPVDDEQRAQDLEALTSSNWRVTRWVIDLKMTPEEAVKADGIPAAPVIGAIEEGELHFYTPKGATTTLSAVSQFPGLPAKATLFFYERDRLYLSWLEDVKLPDGTFRQHNFTVQMAVERNDKGRFVVARGVSRMATGHLRLWALSR